MYVLLIYYDCVMYVYFVWKKWGKLNINIPTKEEKKTKKTFLHSSPLKWVALCPSSQWPHFVVSILNPLVMYTTHHFIIPLYILSTIQLFVYTCTCSMYCICPTIKKNKKNSHSHSCTPFSTNVSHTAHHLSDFPISSSPFCTSPLFSHWLLHCFVYTVHEPTLCVHVHVWLPRSSATNPLYECLFVQYVSNNSLNTSGPPGDATKRNILDGSNVRTGDSHTDVLSVFCWSVDAGVGVWIGSGIT